MIAASSARLKQIDWLLVVLVAISLLLNAAIWAYVALRQPVLPDVLPVHYNAAGQVDRVGLRQQLFILPASGLLMLLVNAGLATALKRRDTQLGYVLLSVAILVQLLLVGAALQLVH